MAEQENLEATKAAYAAFGRGDIPAVLQDLADNVEWISPGESPISGTIRGKAAVQEWFGKLNETMEFQIFDPHDFIAQGDKVVVLVHSETTTVRSTGKKLVTDLAHVHTREKGKLVRFQEYSDTLAFAHALSQ